jgi:cell division protein FtsB
MAIFFRKIKFRVNKILRQISHLSEIADVNVNYLLFIVVTTISVVVLIINIYRIVQRGYERYETIEKEKIRLEELKLTNEELHDELKYYSSKDYIYLKAREEFQMVFPNQRLVYIEKKFSRDEGEIGFDTNEKERKTNFELWYNLIF